VYFVCSADWDCRVACVLCAVQFGTVDWCVCCVQCNVRLYIGVCCVQCGVILEVCVCVLCREVWVCRAACVLCEEQSGIVGRRVCFRMCNRGLYCGVCFSFGAV